MRLRLRIQNFGKPENGPVTNLQNDKTLSVKTNRYADRRSMGLGVFLTLVESSREYVYSRQ